jgi:DNA-binding MarR family transcriptional regulator
MPTWQLSQAYARAQQLLADAFAGAASRGYHYRLLAALTEYGPASQISLGRRTGIDRSDVVAALDEMAERGFVRRTRDEADLRRNVVSVTAAGRRQFRRLDRLVLGVQDDLLAPLSASERRTLVALLGRISSSD